MNIGTLDLMILALAVLVMPAMSLRAGMRMARAAPLSLVPRYWSTIARGWVAAALLVFLWTAAHRPLGDLGLDIPVGQRGLLGFLLDGLLAAFFVAQQIRLSNLTEVELRPLAERIATLKVAPRTRGELGVFLVLSITAGVWEELLYRGFLIWYLSPREGVAAAILLSAIIFGLGHAYQGWRGVATTTLVGLAFAGLFVLTHSLWWLMCAHAITDIGGGFAAYRILGLAGAVKVNRN
jgi:membrane protease YdiL (CAAX protease family)